MKLSEQYHSQLVAANAIELGVRVLNALSGKELSGNARPNCAELVATQLNNKLSTHKEVANVK